MQFVLIAVLFLLCLSVPDVSADGGEAAAIGRVPAELVDENQLHFGDLLVFPGESYNHYALYVDNENLGNERQHNQNIFEMTRTPPGCHFREFHGPFRRHNYLDPEMAPQTPDAMRATIQRLMQDHVCQTYNLLKGNCEQIATFVRYGASHCKQKGTKFETLAKGLPSGSVRPREASAAA